MVTLFWSRLLVVFSALVLAGSSVLSATSSLLSLENAHFEVVGFDQRSVSYMEELSRYTAERSGRFLDAEGMRFPAQILISLRPDEHSDFKGNYQIDVRERGSVELSLKWEPSLNLELACRAISEALILQYAIYNFGPDAQGSTRSWPVTALAADTYFGLRPAKFVGLVGQTRDFPIPSLAPILEARAGDVDAQSAFGYWFLEALKAGLPNRGVLRGIFQQAVAGIDVEDTLTLAIQPAGDEAGAVLADAWWQYQVNELIGREYEVIETMATSRGWLAELASFDEPLQVGGESVAVNLRSLLKYRDAPAVQELIRARYEILKVRFTRVNPAYFNAAKSLGAIYEAFLFDGPAHRFIHSLTVYLSDWEDSKQMQARIEEAL